jgi:hypothetical protein
MAKQAGPFFFTGTIGDVIFYKLGDQYYIRMKGDYNKKRMQKPGAYPLMQLKQAEFGQASKLASQVYRLLPRAQKKQGLFGQYTKAARQLLKEGKTHEEVIGLLQALYIVKKEAKKQQAQTIVVTTPVEPKRLPAKAPKDTPAPMTQSLPANAMLINNQWYVPVVSTMIVSHRPDQSGLNNTLSG